MKGSRALTYVLALALVFSLTACDDNGGGMDDDDDDNGDEPTLLSDILGERDDLSTLFDAVEASGQLNLTEDPNADITVFAPNNNSFADINLEAALSDDNSALLEEVVQYHVLPQSVLSSGLSEGTVETALGDEILITTDDDGNFLVNGNSITTADLEADNGVLHVIDGLLLENRTLLQHLGLTSSTQALLGIASEASLGDAFSNAENWTVFAPINEALVEVDPANFTQEQLQQILQYHVIVDENGPIDAATLQTLLADNGGEVSVQTLQGEDITFTETDSGISINDGQANIVLEGGVDRFAGGLNEAGDGFVNVFHLIDGLLMPPSMQPTEATPIADAREQGVGTEVTIEGTVTRAFGDFARIQDDSGDLGASGMVIRQTEGDFNAEIADGTITEGTTVLVTGTISEFNGLFQINEDDLASYEITGEASVPEPITITLTELANNGLDYESVLVRINGLTLNTEDTEFSNGASYTAVDGDGNEGVFRVQQEGETQLIGEPVPSGSFDYEGVIGQFQGEPQMIPVEVSDIIQE
ncbi:fasciclin domain-containing protein [Longimonas halophila]|nr:fasciclin domain-containing protein [Longimonas halophila]